MGSWITERARQIKDNQEQEHKAQEWELHKASVIAERRFDLWKAVMLQVREDRDAFNREFPGDRHKQIEFNEVPSRTFTLHRAYYPAATVNVAMSLNGRTITITSSRRSTAGAAAVPAEECIIVDLDAMTGEPMLTRCGSPITYEEFSQIVLEPFV